MAQMINPEIERQGLWWAFHRHLIIEMFEWLRENLGDDYLVDLESQLLLVPRFSGQGRSVSPDVEVTLLSGAGAVTAGLMPTPALVEADEALAEVEQFSIQVRRADLPDLFDPFGSRVVTAVELVSPSNKGLTGSVDRRKFLAKRSDYLSSPVSYVEIDLLEAGDRSLPQAVEQLENYPYMAWASQTQRQTRHHWGWGWQEAESLPVITVPLDFPHVHSLDLGQCYRNALEKNRWDVRLAA
jgi:hypothetical protein